ncbi:large-conductance mechanosensitive channel protein MscL [Adhaeribacter aquaticus]|uniref:large-conductance mechanosensitive channel protein MscL n=1 Tax=Adhaeribacter aquaticus TaxID=299567 RepID=UPI0003FA8A7D|nr:large-conductance mechanosensitive channel protein MscL [Adhaeribacter aquaticus]
MRTVSEFKQFAVKGNVIDLAVAVVIGAAFGSIVTSLVNDILMPPIGVATGGVDFTDLKIQLTDPIIENGKVVKAGASLNYGNFIQTVVNFLIIGISIFALVKSINSLKRKEEAAPATPTPTKEELLLTEIRDLLRERKQL